MSKLSVSVVIPVFNGERFLSEAIQSVLDQSLPPSEIHVVDDGSTDRTRRLLKRYEKQIIIHQTPHAGADAARNEGIRHARGEMIAFFDADDIMHPGRLAAQTLALKEDPGLDLVFGHLCEFRGAFSSDVVESVPGKSGHCVGTLMARRESMARAGVFETCWKLASFMEWSFRIQDLGFRFRVLEEVVLYRRLHEDNLSTREISVMAAEYASVIQRRLKRRREGNKENTKQ